MAVALPLLPLKPCFLSLSPHHPLALSKKTEEKRKSLSLSAPLRSAPDASASSTDTDTAPAPDSASSPQDNMQENQVNLCQQGWVLPMPIQTTAPGHVV